MSKAGSGVAHGPAAEPHGNATGWLVRYLTLSLVIVLLVAFQRTGHTRAGIGQATVPVEPDSIVRDWTQSCRPDQYLADPDDATNRRALARLRSCAAGHRLVFVGDSRVRQLFYELASLSDDSIFSESETGTKRHADLNRTVELGGVDDPISLEFFWAPELYDGKFAAVVAALQRAVPSPDLVVISAGLWAHKRGDPLAVVTSAAKNAESALKRRRLRRVFWLPNGEVREDLLHPARANISNVRVIALNAVTRRLFATLPCAAPIGTWWASEVTEIYKSAAAAGETSDGLHFSRATQRAVLNTLLSAYCRGLSIPAEQSN